MEADWSKAIELAKNIQESQEQVRVNLYELGLELLSIRQSYPSNVEFSNARSQYITLSADECTACMWYAGITDEARKQLTDEIPHYSTAQAIRWYSRDRYGSDWGCCSGVTPEQTCLKVDNDESLDIAAIPQENKKAATVDSSEKPSSQVLKGHESLMAKKIGKKSAMLIYATFTSSVTQATLSKSCEDALFRIAKYIRDGKLRGHPMHVTVAPSMRLYDHKMNLTTSKVANWNAFFNRVDELERRRIERERKTEGTETPKAEVNTESALSVPLTVVVPDSRSEIYWHGSKLWPRYCPPGSGYTYDKAIAAVNYLEDTERYLLALGATYADIRHHVMQMCKWFRQADEAFGQMVHEGANAWMNAPGKCEFNRPITNIKV